MMYVCPEPRCLVKDIESIPLMGYGWNGKHLTKGGRKARRQLLPDSGWQRTLVPTPKPSTSTQPAMCAQALPLLSALFSYLLPNILHVRVLEYKAVGA